MSLNKDDLIAKAVMNGLGDGVDLTKLSKSQLETLISESKKVAVKNSVPVKHKFYRG